MRGPWWTKVCDPNRPDKVWYAYLMDEGNVWSPPGVDHFMRNGAKYNGVSLSDAVLASVRYFNMNGNRRTGPLQLPDYNAFGDKLLVEGPYDYTGIFSKCSTQVEHSITLELPTDYLVRHTSLQKSWRTLHLFSRGELG